jgi:magnesium-transporting ATPase (P-type)
MSVYSRRFAFSIVRCVLCSEMGDIAQLLDSSNDDDDGPPASPLQEKLGKLGKRLGLISLCLSLVVFVIGVSTNRGADPTSNDPVWLQMILVSVALTVAAVPEGLPVCVTITLAIGYVVSQTCAGLK